MSKHSKWLKIAEANGISKTTYYGRISKVMGWSPEKAATTPARGKADAEDKTSGISYKEALTPAQQKYMRHFLNSLCALHDKAKASGLGKVDVNLFMVEYRNISWRG